VVAALGEPGGELLVVGGQLTGQGGDGAVAGVADAVQPLLDRGGPGRRDQVATARSACPQPW
jgi:hypothetical protein